MPSAWSPPETLAETFESGVATLTMNRPEARNAMSGPMMNHMEEAIPRLAADPKVRAVVLTGAGGAFCAGGDVKGFASEPSEAAKKTTLEERAWGLRQGVRLVELLHEMPKPTLAAISGACAGGGFSIALACDLRIAVPNAKITTAFSKIGGSGDYGGSYFLTHLVGAAKARELYFLSDVLSGQEALDLGIINAVVPEEVFREETARYAQRLAELPTVAIGFMKKNLNAAMQGATLGQVLEMESAHMTRAMATDDHKAASIAFVEKRKPVFEGR
ncbi:MAG: enoyl-CoA hydratase-related protein [Pseudomonadota bacterium]